MTKNIRSVKKIQLLIIVTIFNFTLFGCGDNKIGSCKLIQEVTTELNQTVVLYLDSEDTIEIQQVADKFKQAEEQILSANIKDENLANLSDQLANIYNQYSIVTSNYIVAYQQRNREKVIQYKEQINQLSLKQNNIIQQINNYCLN